MVFAGPNYAAVIVAAIAAFAAGALWYGVLGRQWLDALGRKARDAKPTAGPFIVSGIAELIMAWILAGVIGHLGEVTIRTGIISGALVWLGFIATTTAVNHAYQGARIKLTLIDGGHWLLVLVLMGAIIGGFGV